MGEALLVVLLVHASSMDLQVRLEAARRLGVGQDNVPQPVREVAPVKQRVRRQREPTELLWVEGRETPS